MNSPRVFASSIEPPPFGGTLIDDALNEILKEAKKFQPYSNDMRYSPLVKSIKYTKSANHSTSKIRRRCYDNLAW